MNWLGSLHRKFPVCVQEHRTELLQKPLTGNIEVAGQRFRAILVSHGGNCCGKKECCSEAVGFSITRLSKPRFKKEARSSECSTGNRSKSVFLAWRKSISSPISWAAPSISASNTTTSKLLKVLFRLGFSSCVKSIISSPPPQIAHSPYGRHRWRGSAA